MLSAEVFEELYRRHGDCLIVPEHEYLQYWSSTAPYRQPPGYGGITPPQVRAVYPLAFSLLSADPGGEHVRENRARYLQAVAEGDVFLVHGWFGGQEAAEFYRAAAAAAPWRVTIGADGGLSLAPQRDGRLAAGEAVTCADARALQAALAERMKGLTAVPPRRVWIAHGGEADPQTVAGAVRAVADAGGIIAWSGPAGE